MISTILVKKIKEARYCGLKLKSNLVHPKWADFRPSFRSRTVQKTPRSQSRLDVLLVDNRIGMRFQII